MCGEANVLCHISFLEQILYEMTKEFAPPWNSTRRWCCCTRHIINKAYKQSIIPQNTFWKALVGNRLG